VVVTLEPKDDVHCVRCVLSCECSELFHFCTK